MTVLEQMAEQLNRGSNVEQAAQRLGISPREAMAAFKELTRQAAREQRTRSTATVAAVRPVPVVAQPEVKAEPVTEQRLWCEAGQHHWMRPARRGRRPRSCPEHR